MNPVGIYYAYWEKEWQADYRRYVEKAASLGFDVLELAAGALMDMTKREMKELSAAASAAGVELTYCIGLPPCYDLSSPDEAVRYNGIEYVKRLLERISWLGGTMLGGIIYASWPGKPDSGITDKTPWWNRAVTSVKKTAYAAEQYGITYCLEVVNRYEQFLLNTAEEGLRFLQDVSLPNVKLLLDAFHMNIEEDDMIESILKAGSRIGHFHVGEQNRRVPGKGALPWGNMIGALEEAGYEGRIVMEPFVKMGGAVGKDINVWRDLVLEGESQLDEDAKGALSYLRSFMK